MKKTSSAPSVNLVAKTSMGLAALAVLLFALYWLWLLFAPLPPAPRIPTPPPTPAVPVPEKVVTQPLVANEAPTVTQLPALQEATMPLQKPQDSGN